MKKEGIRLEMQLFINSIIVPYEIKLLTMIIIVLGLRFIHNLNFDSQYTPFNELSNVTN